MPLSPDIISDLAPTGVRRARTQSVEFSVGDKVNSDRGSWGVAADLAGEVAMRLGVLVKYVTFKSPGELADAVNKDIWDIGLIGAVPSARRGLRSPPPTLKSTKRHIWWMLVRSKQLFYAHFIGVRIAVTARSAYGLWLDRNIKHAELKRSEKRLIAHTSSS